LCLRVLQKQERPAEAGRYTSFGVRSD